jgi:deoxyribonuclease V
VDVAYSKDGTCAFAAAVVMDASFSVAASFTCSGEPDGPYAPGFLAFREGRLTILALAGVIEATRLAAGARPDIVFLDGHGVVHERGLGLASHVGVLMDLPTVGVPKTPFHAIDHLPDEPRGSYYVLTKEWGAEGASLRLRTGVKPVYVSPGHRMDLQSAIRLCLEWSTGRHKVPEPLAAAHTLSVRARNGAVDALPSGC